MGEGADWDLSQPVGKKCEGLAGVAAVCSATAGPLFAGSGRLWRGHNQKTAQDSAHAHTRAAVCSNLCNEWVAVECGAPTGWPNGLAVNILFFLFPRRDRAVEFLKQGQI